MLFIEDTSRRQLAGHRAMWLARHPCGTIAPQLEYTGIAALD
jgi:hypothetical protein